MHDRHDTSFYKENKIAAMLCIIFLRELLPLMRGLLDMYIKIEWISVEKTENTTGLSVNLLLQLPCFL